MRIAVVGDIHGEIACLKNALDDLNMRNIDAVFSTGDLVDTEQNAKEIILLCRQGKIISVKGNHDEMTAESSICDPDSKAYLARLPFSFGFRVFGWSITIIHGSQSKNTEYLYEDSPATQHFLDNAAQHSVLICGHTHIPYIKNHGSVYVMSPGSISRPKAPAHPSYLILELTPSGLGSDLIIL